LRTNLRRDAKILALRTISSAPGSNPVMAAPILKLIRQGYGPISHPTEREAALLASACVSVDFDVTVPSRFDDNRRGTSSLIELARRYEIPITWAVCGNSAEKDMKSYLAIADSAGHDEIGVHTYSHLDATRASEEEFRADVQRCVRVLGLDSPRTFVFPWNREAHFRVLDQLGFRVFRGKARAIGNPILTQGIWNVRPVYYLDRKSLGAESLIKKYVDVCVALSTPFHLWTHPWAVASGHGESPLKPLESVFAHIAEKRDDGEIRTATLGEMAASLDALRASAKEVAA
jgi:peptidoglycan/xylan/chitin deacetylase (PgdA/CDA1 family)